MAEEEGGKTVTLQLVPLSSGAGQTLGSGLKGYRQVSNWTPEVAGTEKVLVAEKTGESTVKWHVAKPGVWKAELAIRTGGEIVHSETRILDLRRYVGSRLMMILK